MDLEGIDGEQCKYRFGPESERVSGKAAFGERKKERHEFQNPSGQRPELGSHGGAGRGTADRGRHKLFYDYNKARLEASTPACFGTAMTNYGYATATVYPLLINRF